MVSAPLRWDRRGAHAAALDAAFAVVIVVLALSATVLVATAIPANRHPARHFNLLRAG